MDSNFFLISISQFQDLLFYLVDFDDTYSVDTPFGFTCFVRAPFLSCVFVY